MSLLTKYLVCKVGREITTRGGISENGIRWTSRVRKSGPKQFCYNSWQSQPDPSSRSEPQGGVLAAADWGPRFRTFENLGKRIHDLRTHQTGIVGGSQPPPTTIGMLRIAAQTRGARGDHKAAYPTCFFEPTEAKNQILRFCAFQNFSRLLIRAGEKWQ